MSSYHITPSRGSDRAAALEHALVADVMRPGIISCDPRDDLSTVARVLVANRVHAVVVSGIEPAASGGEHLAWGLVTALDLVTAMLPGVDATDAGALANTEIITVDASEPLERAVQIMAEHQLTHLMVVSGSRPVGIVSTLDIVGCVAGGDA